VTFPPGMRSVDPQAEADRLAEERKAATRAAADRMNPVIHACPPSGGSVMGCCGRRPSELAGLVVMTTDPAEVTCGRPSHV
jgi:hypothetical protein